MRSSLVPVISTLCAGFLCVASLVACSTPPDGPATESTAPTSSAPTPSEAAPGQESEPKFGSSVTVRDAQSHLVAALAEAGTFSTVMVSTQATGMSAHSQSTVDARDAANIKIHTVTEIGGATTESISVDGKRYMKFDGTWEESGEGTARLDELVLLGQPQFDLTFHDTQQIDGEALQYYEGHDANTKIELWIDEDSRPRRILVTAQGVEEGESTSGTEMVFSGFGADVSISAPQVG